MSINYLYNASNGSLTLKDIRNFDLSDIFDCGQCFRFNKTDTGSYKGVAHGRFIEISQNGADIILNNVTPNEYDSIWHDFFDMDFNYTECANHFPKDDTLKKAAQFAKGIRILHQEHWETLCSFIISQNNNIPRIKKIIETLCKELGEVIYTDQNGTAYYSFPSPEKILDAGEQAIFDMKTGFRAKYIIDAAQKIVSGAVSFDEIEKSTTEKALEMLCNIKGVGPKVASCVLLFSFRKYDCFPIDVWVKKILDKYYPDFKSKEYFGEYAGIAQQYLFYYERCINGVYLK